MPTDATQTTPLSTLDVLFVDDSPNLCRAMELWLKSSGYSAKTAPTAAAAEVIALREHPQVIITDIGLPDCSGYELQRRLLAEPAMAHTHFIALSGRREKGDPRQAIESGFDTFIAKPPDFEELSAILRKCIPGGHTNED